jgi:hypothetical protein
LAGEKKIQHRSDELCAAARMGTRKIRSDDIGFDLTSDENDKKNLKIDI